MTPLRATNELRLTSPAIQPTGLPAEISFEGEPVMALAGESLAAALTAAGHLGLRQAGPDDRRGLFCGMGVCQECLVEIDGRGAQRACMTATSPGMTVRRHDPATTELLSLARAPNEEPPVESCEVAIVGAGPAGLVAAIALAEAGIRPVVIDERATPGGQFFKALAPSQSFAARGEDRQFAQGRRLVARARALGAEFRSAHTVWQAGVTEEGGVSLGVHTPERAYVIEARALLIATGAYERPLHVPGWTLPGVMTTGAAQTLARAYRVAPGRQVVVAGNGPLNWQLALEIAENGGTVVAVIEAGRPLRIANAASGLAMLWASPQLTAAGLGLRLRLRRAGIPLYQGYRIVALEGDGRVERAIAAPVDGSGPPLVLATDAAVLGYGFAPSTELARLLGVEVTIDPDTGYPVPALDVDGRAAERPVWVAGDAGGIGGSEVALGAGQRAAASILSFLGHPKPANANNAKRQLERAQAFQRALWSMFAAPPPSPAPPETLICRCENVTAGAITALRDQGVCDLGGLKRLTRLGMGRCQGRYCAATALKMLGRQGAAATGAELFAPQAPIKPIPAILLAAEKPEWGGHREVPLQSRKLTSTASDPLPETCDLLVIGAGIIGASTAMFAAGKGMDTVVVDRRPPNSEASGGNAGSLHVQLLSWDFGSKAMAGGTPALQTLPLQRDSVALWKRLETDLGEDFEITTTGGLMLAENDDQTAFLRSKADAERKFGIDVEVIGRSELASLAPAISDRMRVAAYCAAEGKINPLKATPAIVREAQRLGARFASGHNVTVITPSGDGYLVTTSNATIRARRIVVAAGGWSRLLGRLLGIELPISGAPLQMLVTEPTRPILRQLVAHADRHLTMKQATNGNLIIGGAWTAGTDAATGYARVLRGSIEGNLWVAERTVSMVGGLHLLRSWAAMNVNIDGAPLLGEIPGLPGVFIAATANGYTLGPIMGQATADLVLGQRRPDLDAFTLGRFG